MIFRYKKFITVFLLVAVFGMVAHPVFADVLGVAEAILQGANSVLGAIINFEFGLIYAVGELLNFLIQPGNTPIITSTIVQAGWTTMRDFANMFFLLILLALALSYILFPSFPAKQALPKLLIVALLINFSLPITGIFLDASNVFTNHFLSEATDGNNKLSDSIMQNLGAQKMKDMGDIGETINEKDAGKERLDIEKIILTNQIIQIPFLVVTLFILVALAFMFLVRLGYIYILLIMLPLALLAYTWPSTQSHFGRWQSKFFQWVFFPPIAMFFIDISMKTHASILSIELTNEISGAADNMGLFSGIFKQIYQYIIIFALLIGSLVAAQSMSITGASASMKMLQGAGRSIRGAAWRGTKRGTARIAEKAGVPEKLGKAAEISGRLGIFARPLTRVLGRAEVGIKAGAAKRFEMSSAEKQAAEKMSSEALRGQMRAGGPKAHMYASILASRGKLDPTNAAKYLEDAEKYGNKEAAKQITKAAPQAAESRILSQLNTMSDKDFIKEFGVSKTSPGAMLNAQKQRAKNIWGSISPNDVKNIDPSLLSGTAGENYIKGLMSSGNMSGEHLKVAAREGNWAFVDAYKRIPDTDKTPRMRAWETSPAAIGII